MIFFVLIVGDVVAEHAVCLPSSFDPHDTTCRRDSTASKSENTVPSRAETVTLLYRLHR